MSGKFLSCNLWESKNLVAHKLESFNGLTKRKRPGFCKYYIAESGKSSPDQPPAHQVRVLYQQVGEVRDCEAVTPVMIRRVPVPSPDHQDEPGQAVPGYSPPERYKER